VEDKEANMTRLLISMDHDIANIVELQDYIVLKDMAHMVTKVERQLKKKDITRKVFNSGFSLSWG
jgi:hypothetical protein